MWVLQGWESAELEWQMPTWARACGCRQQDRAGMGMLGQHWHHMGERVFFSWVSRVGPV